MSALPNQPPVAITPDLKVITGRQPAVTADGDSQATIDLLAANLGHQVEVYERLLELARFQQRSIRARDVERVHAVLQEIELAMMDRSRIEMQRAHIVATLAAQLGVHHDEVTVSTLAEHIGSDLSEEMSAAADHLRSVIAELDPIVTQNNALLQHELELIDGMVRMATAGGEGPTYARPGSSREIESIQLLDLQV